MKLSEQIAELERRISYIMDWSGIAIGIGIGICFGYYYETGSIVAPVGAVSLVYCLRKISNQ